MKGPQHEEDDSRQAGAVCRWSDTRNFIGAFAGHRFLVGSQTAARRRSAAMGRSESAEDQLARGGVDSELAKPSQDIHAQQRVATVWHHHCVNVSNVASAER